MQLYGDSRVTEKVTEKHQCYTDLKMELQKMWKMQVVIIPLVLGTLGTCSSTVISTTLENYKHLLSWIS